MTSQMDTAMTEHPDYKFPPLPHYPGVTAEGLFSLFSWRDRMIDVGPRNGDFLFSYCTSGIGRGCVDLEPIEITAGSIAVFVPGQLIQPIELSHDFEAMIMVLSPEFVDGMSLPYDFHLATRLRDTPVLPTVSDEIHKAVTVFFNAAYKIILGSGLYKIPILRHLTAAFGYVLVSYAESVSRSMVMTNDRMIMHRFMSEVKKHCLEERKVSCYASRLNLTAPYLSAVIKGVSGHPPSYWIDRYIAEMACGLLRSTDLTIAEISDELRFTSQSFFGKFFKRVTGQPPSSFRDQLRHKDEGDGS